VCIDSSCIGNLKSIGKLWQLTACDAASSYAMAALVPVSNATETASFLRDVATVEMEKEGWELRPVLTDGGSEFNGEFDQIYRGLNARHSRTQPRHPWTHAFGRQAPRGNPSCALAARLSTTPLP